MSIAKQNVSLSLQDIIVGVIETNASLLNYLIVLGKSFIWNSRKQATSTLLYYLCMQARDNARAKHVLAFFFLK